MKCKQKLGDLCGSLCPHSLINIHGSSSKEVTARMRRKRKCDVIGSRGGLQPMGVVCKYDLCCNSDLCRKNVRS